ncbi:MAG: hypothetical protein K2X48_18545 [Chitinophagaceae bacterium]|nr:hypothetical protein [Chitinophagaceae bacterium]
MNKNRRLIIAALLLIVTITNYSRLSGTENIRTVHFLSILQWGCLQVYSSGN